MEEQLGKAIEASNKDDGQHFFTTKYALISVVNIVFLRYNALAHLIGYSVVST